MANLRALAEQVLEIQRLCGNSTDPAECHCYSCESWKAAQQLAAQVQAALDSAPPLSLYSVTEDGHCLRMDRPSASQAFRTAYVSLHVDDKFIARADHDAVILRLTSQLHDAKGVMPSATGSSPAQDSAEAGVTHPATNTSAIPECLSALLARWRGEAYTLGEANLDDSGHYPTRALRAERAKTLRECADSLEGAHGQAAARSLATDAPTITQGPNASGGDSADDVARVSRLGTIGTREYFTSGNSGVTTGDLGRYALLRQERTKELEASLQAQAATIQQRTDELKHWRDWAQFVYGKGGPLSGDDAHLRLMVCRTHDRELEAAKARVATLTQRIAELEDQVHTLLTQDQWNT